MAGEDAGLAQLFPTQAALYAAATTVIETVLREAVEPRSLDWASLHGLGGPREDDIATPNGALPEVTRFMETISSALKARGRQRWHIRQILNIDSVQALDRILSRLRAREGCGADYEVWAYSVRDAPPVLSPLIVSSRWLFSRSRA